jgi:hypothetical protein
MIESNSEFSTLSERVRAVRLDLFGDEGGALLASLLGIPERRVARMEMHGPIPGHIILAFIEVTGANPSWLLSGNGDRYTRLAAERRGGHGPEGHRVSACRHD